MVPTALATMAKTPSGVSRDTPLVTRIIAWVRSARSWRRPCFSSIPMSAPPTARLNTTTAGTRLLARAWKGLEGMNSVSHGISTGGSTRDVLKKEASSQGGKARGISRIVAKASPQEPRSKAPTLRGERSDVLQAQAPQPRDQRQGDIGQHRHLEQEDEGFPKTLEPRGLVPNADPPPLAPRRAPGRLGWRS